MATSGGDVDIIIPNMGHSQHSPMISKGGSTRSVQSTRSLSVFVNPNTSGTLARDEEMTISMYGDTGSGKSSTRKAKSTERSAGGVSTKTSNKVIKSSKSSSSGGVINGEIKTTETEQVVRSSKSSRNQISRSGSGSKGKEKSSEKGKKKGVNKVGSFQMKTAFGDSLNRSITTRSSTAETDRAHVQYPESKIKTTEVVIEKNIDQKQAGPSEFELSSEQTTGGQIADGRESGRMTTSYYRDVTTGSKASEAVRDNESEIMPRESDRILTTTSVRSTKEASPDNGYEVDIKERGYVTSKESGKFTMSQSPHAYDVIRHPSGQQTENQKSSIHSGQNITTSSKYRSSAQSNESSRQSKPGSFLVRTASNAESSSDPRVSRHSSNLSDRSAEVEFNPIYQTSAAVAGDMEIRSETSEMKSSKSVTPSREQQRKETSIEYSRSSTKAKDNKSYVSTPASGPSRGYKMSRSSQYSMSSSSPTSPIHEVRQTVKEGTVDQLVKNVFRDLQLTGRSLSSDPSSPDRLKSTDTEKSEGETPSAGTESKKFKFLVEGIDFPKAEEEKENDHPKQRYSHTAVFSEDEIHDPRRIPTPPNIQSLERKPRGFSYVEDEEQKSEMVKRAEHVTSKKPHEIQSPRKQQTDEEKQQHSMMLRQIRSQLNKSESPERIQHSRSIEYNAVERAQTNLQKSEMMRTAVEKESVVSTDPRFSVDVATAKTDVHQQTETQVISHHKPVIKEKSHKKDKKKGGRDWFKRRKAKDLERAKHEEELLMAYAAQDIDPIDETTQNITVERKQDDKGHKTYIDSTSEPVSPDEGELSSDLMEEAKFTLERYKERKRKGTEGSSVSETTEIKQGRQDTGPYVSRMNTQNIELTRRDGHVLADENRLPSHASLNNTDSISGVHKQTVHIGADDSPSTYVSRQPVGKQSEGVDTENEQTRIYIQSYPTSPGKIQHTTYDSTAKELEPPDSAYQSDFVVSPAFDFNSSVHTTNLSKQPVAPEVTLNYALEERMTDPNDFTRYQAKQQVVKETKIVTKTVSPQKQGRPDVKETAARSEVSTVLTSRKDGSGAPAVTATAISSVQKRRVKDETGEHESVDSKHVNRINTKPISEQEIIRAALTASDSVDRSSRGRQNKAAIQQHRQQQNVGDESQSTTYTATADKASTEKDIATTEHGHGSVNYRATENRAQSGVTQDPISRYSTAVHVQADRQKASGPHYNESSTQQILTSYSTGHAVSRENPAAASNQQYRREYLDESQGLEERGRRSTSPLVIHIKPQHVQADYSDQNMKTQQQSSGVTSTVVKTTRAWNSSTAAQHGTHDSPTQQRFISNRNDNVGKVTEVNNNYEYDINVANLSAPRYLKVDESTSGRVPKYRSQDIAVHNIEQSSSVQQQRSSGGWERRHASPDHHGAEFSDTSSEGGRHTDRHSSSNVYTVQKATQQRMVSQPIDQPHHQRQDVQYRQKQKSFEISRDSSTLENSHNVSTLSAPLSPSSPIPAAIDPQLEDVGKAGDLYHISVKLNNTSSRPASRASHYGEQMEQKSVSSATKKSSSYHAEPLSPVTTVNIYSDSPQVGKQETHTSSIQRRSAEYGTYGTRDEKYLIADVRESQRQPFSPAPPGTHVQEVYLEGRESPRYVASPPPRPTSDGTFSMGIDQTMTMDYVPRQHEREVVTHSYAANPLSQPQQVRRRHDQSTTVISQRHDVEDETDNLDKYIVVRRNNMAEEDANQQRMIYVEDDLEQYLSPDEDDDDDIIRYSEDVPVMARGSILIRNTIDTTGAAKVIDVVTGDSGDEMIFDDNPNPFESGFSMRKENPLYASDPDLSQYKEEYTEIRRPTFTRVFEEHVKSGERKKRSRKVNGILQPEALDSEDYTTEFHITRAGSPGARKTRKTTERHVKSEQVNGYDDGGQRRSKTQTWSEQEIARLLANAPPGSIKQTINVEREEEEIIGPLPASGSDGGPEGLLNFDTVSEKVDLDLKDGKSIVAVKVRCERIVPIRGVEDMFKKSSVIVTRLIEIDLQVTEERKRLYDNIMYGSSKRMITAGDGKKVYEAQPRRKLTTKETFKLYKTFMGLADADEGQREKMKIDRRIEESSRPDLSAKTDLPADLDTDDFEFDDDKETIPNYLHKKAEADTTSYTSAASETSGLLY